MQGISADLEVPVGGKSYYFFFQGLHWKIEGLKSKFISIVNEVKLVGGEPSPKLNKGVPLFKDIKGC